jgi:hypothetical protein
MRAFKLILTVLLAAVAVTAGLFVAAIVALVGLAIYVVGRLLGVQSRFRVDAPRFRRQSNPTRRPSDGDAIEVTTSEVTPEPARSLTSGSTKDQRLSA